MLHQILLKLYCHTAQRFACLFFLLIIGLLTNAQTNTFFSPVKDDTVSLASSLTAISARYTTEVSVLQGDNKKYTAGIYKERFNSLKEMFDTREILTLPEAETYLQSLAGEIVRNNPALQALNINFFFSKTAVPNAMCMGERVIIFNAGLFTKLDNESQAAFVLCHELAHLYLDHSNKGIDKYIATLYSKETQEQLKNIKKSIYNKNSQLESLLKGMTFDTRRHSRDHESEADSLGLQFMKNTGFDVNEALTCLALLDSVDNDNTNTASLLSGKFNSSEYPFKQKWIAKEQGLGASAELEIDKKEEDSLKTHPDCSARIIALKNEVDKLKNTNRKKDIINRDEFLHLQQLLPYYIIGYYYNSRQYSASLFYALELLENKPMDEYAISAIGQTMNGLFDAQKAHIFSQVAEHPSPYLPANYNLLLQFLQRLYPEEIASVNYYFLKQYEKQLLPYPAYNAALSTAKKLAGK